MLDTGSNPCAAATFNIQIDTSQRMETLDAERAQRDFGELLPGLGFHSPVSPELLCLEVPELTCAKYCSGSPTTLKVSKVTRTHDKNFAVTFFVPSFGWV